jgi:hypothetical protein
MAFNFPDSPNIGDTYNANGKTWQWDGVAWRGSTITSIDADTLDGKDSSEYLLASEGTSQSDAIAYSIALG